MPLALEQLDLRGYDLIISSESGPAKGILCDPDSVHICYCHTPMRYIWNMFHDYRASPIWLRRQFISLAAHYLRHWDYLSAQRVDYFIANSNHVAKRIRHYYRRSTDVIHPPVDLDKFQPAPPHEIDDYHLMVGELIAYKRPDLAIEAFNQSGEKLVVIGGGEMLKKLQNLAKPNIEFLGRASRDVLSHHYARCQALIFPGEEDFGIVPLEAMASGRPVIAFNRGGAIETIKHGITGLLFDDQTTASLLDALAVSRTLKFDPQTIRSHAEGFSEPAFMAQMNAFISRALNQSADWPNEKLHHIKKQFVEAT